MRIVHVSSLDGRGGAGRAAYRLHAGLCRMGHDSRMLVAEKTSNDPAVVVFQRSRKFQQRLMRFLRRERIKRSFGAYDKLRPVGVEEFSCDRSQYGAEVVGQIPQCDIINLHWVSGFLDYEAFFRNVPANTPIVWTLHDMNVFTGGCHYDLNCARYKESCGACPQLGSVALRDLSWEVLERKKNLLQRRSGGRLHFVADSYWLAGEARQSALLSSFPVSTIHYGLDTEVFAPRDRIEARLKLGIPTDAQVVLFVSHAINQRRKGFALLVDALRGISEIRNLLLLSLGAGRPEISLNVAHKHLGHQDNDEILSFIYSAADVFVIPSTQEAFGQTALEAMACGTPVVGFDVGGIPDMISHERTGLLVPVSDVKALREAIAILLEDKSKRDRMSLECRQRVMERFRLEDQAGHYASLYEQMLTRSAL